MDNAKDSGKTYSFILFIHFHIGFFSEDGCGDRSLRRTRNEICFKVSATSDSSAGSTPRWGQTRWEVKSRHQVHGRYLGRSNALYRQFEPNKTASNSTLPFFN